MIEQIAWNKLSFFLTKDTNVKKTQTLQLFALNIKTEIIYKSLIKCQALDWQRPIGLIKRGRKCKRFKWRLKNCFD